MQLYVHTGKNVRKEISKGIDFSWGDFREQSLGKGTSGEIPDPDKYTSGSHCHANVIIDGHEQKPCSLP